MRRESKYLVIVLDREGFTMSESEVETLKEAKARAKYKLTDDWARSCESTHENLGTHKVEIRNQDDECVWDKFYEKESDDE